MSEIYELADGKNMQGIADQIVFQIVNGEDPTGNIISELLFIANTRAEFTEEARAEILYNGTYYIIFSYKRSKEEIPKLTIIKTKLECVELKSGKKVYYFDDIVSSQGICATVKTQGLSVEEKKETRDMVKSERDVVQVVFPKTK